MDTELNNTNEDPSKAIETINSLIEKVELKIRQFKAKYQDQNN